MNLPNKLTVARLVLTIVFVACFYAPIPNPMTWALLVFSIASITDYLDGYLARKHNLFTNFGKLVDPLADKILIAAAFILLVEKTEMKAWIAIAILGREFFVTGIRLVAANQGVVLAAEKLGKHKMVWQIITVVYFMLKTASNEPVFAWASPLFSSNSINITVGATITYFTTAITLVSGYSYFWKNRSLFSDM
jgi:CDP-diacylglycerol--glycerol-3-phosphate 3-phosphatidyltransferase